MMIVVGTEGQTTIERSDASRTDRAKFGLFNTSI
jgi:hypothetical protein